MSFYCLNILLGMFLPEDTSTITLRKKIMCFIGLIGLFAVGFRLPVAILAITDQGTTWASMFMLFAALARATGIVHYTIARYHRTASNPQMLWVCITTGLSTTLTCFADPTSFFGAYHAVVQLLVMWVVDIQPRTPFVIWTVVMNLVVWWNQSVLAMQDPELHPWLLAAPGAQLGGSGSVALHLLDWAIGWGGVSVLIVGLVHIETREYKYNLKGSKFANEVVELMLEQLRTFDVQAAQQTLRHAESVVDEETKHPMLAAQFSDLLESLCDQLESYRPFLPNWVLMPQEDEGADGMWESVGPNETRDPSIPEANPLSGDVGEQQQISVQVKVGGAGSSAEELSDISSNDFEASAEELQSVSSPLRVSPKLIPVKGKWTVADTSDESLSTTHLQKMSPRRRVSDSANRKSPESPGVRRRFSAGRKGSVGTILNTGPVLKSLRTITVSLLDFAPQLGGITKEAVYMQVLQGVLDAVARSAKTTHASIHGTTGDQIAVAWNASHNVAQPELKACQFLCQVKAQVAERNFANVHLSAGAKTGKAWCHHVVSNTGSKTSSFAIHYPWRSALHALCRHAKSFRTILVDEQTFELGQLQCQGWLVDALAPAKAETPAGDRVEVFESVLNAVPHTTSTSAILHASASSSHAPGSLNLCQASGSISSIPPLMKSSSNASLKSPTNLQLPQKSLVLCYELLNEKPVANDEWLYALQASEGSPYESMTRLAMKWMTSRNICNSSQRPGGPGGYTKSRVAFSPEMAPLRYAAPNENQPGLFSISPPAGGDSMILQLPPQIPSIGEPQPLPERSSSSLSQESATLLPVLLGNASTATATLTDENTQKKVQSPEAAHVLRSMEEGKVPSTLLARRLLSKSNERKSASDE